MDNNFKTFVFRDIRQDEVDQAFEIELLCFPPNEACTREMFAERINLVPDLFLVAEDTNTGMIAGFLTGIATNEHSFRDEFFGHASLNDPSGETVMLVGLNVRPEYRMHGLARELVRKYAERESARGRKRLVLTCHDRLIPMYCGFGFADLGLSASVWGGEVWHDMELALDTVE